MPCEHVQIGGADAIVCSPGRRRKFCPFCRTKPATKLCDFPVGHPSRAATCDAEMCEVCAEHIGHDLDYCPMHSKAARRAEETDAMLRRHGLEPNE